jgi:PAS domain S-box-containing protein
MNWQDQLAQLSKIIEKSAGSADVERDRANARRAISLLGEQIEELVRNLQITEDRARTLVTAIPVGLLICSEAGKCEAANPAALSLFKCKYADEMRGRNLNEIFTINGVALQPSTAASEAPDWTRTDSTEVEARKVDGTTFPAEIVIRPFATPGTPRILVVVEDVTARHEIERLKEEFVSMLSHDLRMPLTSLRLFMELVASGRYDADPENLRAKARAMEEESVRLLGMVNNLLDMHKLETHGLEMFFDVVPCGEILRLSVQSVETLAETRKIQLNTVPYDKQMHVRADVQYVVQVLVNLLSNAIKFSPPDKSIELLVVRQGRLVKFTVKDKGRGISPEFRERMFNRFEQARLAEDRLKGGSGLGLAISKAIVEQHGGTIGVDSEEGKGSSFWFTLEHIDLDI